MTDVEITAILASALMGIVTFFFVPASIRRAPGRAIACSCVSIILGLAAGFIAVRMTKSLEGCSIVKSKDNDFYLIWGTDDVMVRIAASCGVAGVVLGALVQTVFMRLRTLGFFWGGEINGPTTAKTNTKESNLKSATADNQEKSSVIETTSAMLIGAMIGFLGGALLVGLPASFILMVVRSAL